MRNGRELYTKAKKIIPGGTQLLSKRPEMFLPDHWPSYYAKCKGVDVWGLDGTKYIDMSTTGVGTCVLGFSDPDVDGRVKDAIDNGVMCTLNCPEEVELSELLIELHPWSAMVRFARTGGEAMAIAVRIARAFTGKDKIAFCGYHGWHDWYLAANLAHDDSLGGHLLSGLSPRGVPKGLTGTAIPFSYNRPGELDAIIDREGKEIAAIVMEPVRQSMPVEGFLQHVREVADKSGAILIFDEVTSGFRMTAGGIHLIHDVNPDIAVFAKGISNGYPMAAILGIRNVMDAAQKTFISSTNWTERIGPAAALATIAKFRDKNVANHLNTIGELIRKGWKEAADRHGLNMKIAGIPPLSILSFDYGEDSQAVQTLFSQAMLQRGFLASKAFYASFAHKEAHIADYLKALDDVFALLKRALDKNEVCKQLLGPVAHTGFKRLA